MCGGRGRQGPAAGGGVGESELGGEHVGRCMSRRGGTERPPPRAALNKCALDGRCGSIRGPARFRAGRWAGWVAGVRVVRVRPDGRIAIRSAAAVAARAHEAAALLCGGASESMASRWPGEILVPRVRVNDGEPLTSGYRSSTSREISGFVSVPRVRDSDGCWTGLQSRARRQTSDP